MSEPVWLDRQAVQVLHDRSLSLHGGAAGLRDEGLFESAMLRPENRFHYEGEKDLFELAATYGVGLAKNHPFIDGNKRVAFAAVGVFLGVNEIDIEAEQAEATAVVLALAAGEISASEFAEWLRRHVIAPEGERS